MLVLFNLSLICCDLMMQSSEGNQPVKKGTIIVMYLTFKMIRVSTKFTPEENTKIA